VPVPLAGLEEDAVARPDHLDRSALVLAEADAFGDPDRLPAWMRVPGRPRAGREVDVAAPTAQCSSGVAIVSMKTEPVNQSDGPALVSRVFLVICMLDLRGIDTARRR
jgi:hypothetical protein